MPRILAICPLGHLTDTSTRARRVDGKEPTVISCLVMVPYGNGTRGQRECGLGTRDASEAEAAAYQLGGAEGVAPLWDLSDADDT